jgi:hypothetical protein
MDIKIESDGTAVGTTVTTESGESIGVVRSVDIHLDAITHLATATIQTSKQKFHFEGNFETKEEIIRKFVEWQRTYNSAPHNGHMMKEGYGVDPVAAYMREEEEKVLQSKGHSV